MIIYEVNSDQREWFTNHGTPEGTPLDSNGKRPRWNQLQPSGLYGGIMKATFFISTLLLIVLTASCSMPGGYSRASSKDENVIRAAAFAVTSYEDHLKQTNSPGTPTRLELIKIEEAHTQVVAGQKYVLRLRVSENGKNKTARAVVVWHQSYRLVSWKWEK